LLAPKGGLLSPVVVGPLLIRRLFFLLASAAAGFFSSFFFLGLLNCERSIFSPAILGPVNFWYFVTICSSSAPLVSKPFDSLGVSFSAAVSSGFVAGVWAAGVSMEVSSLGVSALGVSTLGA